MNTQSTCLQAIQESYPNLEIRSSRLHTNDGQFSDILFVNDDLIFRFPRYAEGIPGFVRETEVLTKLQGHLPLPIPHPLYIGQNTSEPGKVFIGYKLISGEPLWRDRLNKVEDVPTLNHLARQLASFLYALHSLDPLTLGLSLPHEDTLAVQRAFYDEIRAHLFSFMHPEARIAVTKHFKNYFNKPRLHQYTPALYHGDFGSSNILHDPASMEITGIIDFGFAGFGDPAHDLAAISTYGEDFFTRICDYYPADEAMLARAKFYRGTFALHEALHGWKHKNQAAFKSGMEQYM